MAVAQTPNIDIKVLVMKTLINILHKTPEIINKTMQMVLETIISELKQYDSFKKIIPMGPYKYVVDEGVEIRKLAFEMIYSLINNDAIALDREFYINAIIDRGLVDPEFDIINLAYISLGKLVQKAPQFLNNTTNVHKLIHQFTANAGRKLKAKSTAQEVEVFHESIGHLKELVGVINDIMVKNNWHLIVWDQYYQSVYHVRGA